MTEDVDELVRVVLADVLALDPERVARFDARTELFGALPELDSMAVAGLLTEIEDRCRITIDDDDIDADTLATFGMLVDFVRAKLGA